MRQRARTSEDMTVVGHGATVTSSCSTSPAAHGEQVWAVEDCRHVSGALERFLLGAGETVIRACRRSMMSGARKTRATRGKSDPDRRAPRSRGRRSGSPTAARLFSPAPSARSRCWSAIARPGGRAHPVVQAAAVAVARPRPGLEPADRMLSQLATIKRVDRRLARLKPQIARRICREHLARLRDLTRRIDALKRELTPMVRRHAPQLLLMPGCGTIVAARIIAEVANINRFQTDAQLALYAGIAPLDASSGNKSATGSTAPATASSTTPSTSSPSPRPASTRPRASTSPVAKPTARPTRKRSAPSNASSSAASSPSCAPSHPRP